ncbi:hypothetical protein GWE18_33475 [Bradyrhizobium sp. CSA112]|uniref:hypothetical protein n=1 Tax=Bradyrhizobium sp. CSA112 TaxID=2699170 RepID=UPI0023AE798B|nr:hypothetical protein [Bradyrhizobium sp. CSA112]MDE5457640.1 hypothetical protein [Bradyrhizobium sp. CSA112]
MIKLAIAASMAVLFGMRCASAETIEQRMHQPIEEWARQTGEYVPFVVRQEYAKMLSDQVAVIVSDLQREKLSGSSHGMGKSQGQVAEGQVIAAQPSEPEIAAMVTAQLTRQATGQLGLWLQRFPTVRVVVQPTPPKDFLLTINGEQCPATEKAMYRVPAGAVTIRVWRQGSAPCEKTYNTVAGAVYDVQCAF